MINKVYSGLLTKSGCCTQPYQMGNHKYIHYIQPYVEIPNKIH